MEKLELKPSSDDRRQGKRMDEDGSLRQQGAAEAASASTATAKVETARLKIILRAQNEAFVRRVQGWAERLRDLSPGCSCPPHGGPRADTTRRTALHGQLLVEMLRYQGEPAPTPTPADVERAHDRLKQLQDGAAQVAAAAAEGRPR